MGIFENTVLNSFDTHKKYLDWWNNVWFPEQLEESARMERENPTPRNLKDRGAEIYTATPPEQPVPSWVFKGVVEYKGP